MGNYKPYPFKIPFTRPVTIPFKRPFDVADDCVLCLVPEIRTKWFDQSINGLNGVIDGATKVDGRFGMGLLFDGINDNVSIPSLAALGLIDNTKGSILIWIKHTEAQGGTVGIIKFPGWKPTIRLVANEMIVVWVDSTGMSGASGNRTLTHSITTGEWAHIGFTWNSDNYKFYLNGTKMEESDGCAFGAILNGDLSLGSETPSNWFKGIIDELEILNRALTADEMKAVYDMGKPEG